MTKHNRRSRKRLKLLKKVLVVKPSRLDYDPVRKSGLIRINSRYLKDFIGEKVKVVIYLKLERH